MFAVVVTGLPGSGKTSVAVPLAQQLSLPLIAKDHIKEILADSMGLGPLAERYGATAVRMLLALADRAPEVVLESFFWPGVAEPDLLALNRPLIQVHCHCPPLLARERFERRLRDGDRHPVHHGMDDWQRFTSMGGRLDLGGPLVQVDTTKPLDLDAITRSVRLALDSVE